MSSVQIEQKSYEMPPREGISIAHFLTVADIERSARYYEKVFGARILSLGDGKRKVSHSKTKVKVIVLFASGIRQARRSSAQCALRIVVDRSGGRLGDGSNHRKRRNFRVAGQGVLRSLSLTDRSQPLRAVERHFIM